MWLDQVSNVWPRIKKPAGPRLDALGKKEPQPGVCRNNDAVELGVSFRERRAATRNGEGSSVRAAVLRLRQPPPQRRPDMLKHGLVRRCDSGREHLEDAGRRARASVSRSHYEMIDTRSAVNGLFSSNSA